MKRDIDNHIMIVILLVLQSKNFLAFDYQNKDQYILEVLLSKVIYQWFSFLKAIGLGFNVKWNIININRF